MFPTFTHITYSYSKSDTPLSVLRLDDLPLDQSQIQDQQIAFFGPMGKGGNHTHPRIEWMIGFGADLVLYWLNDKNEKQSCRMNPNDKLILIEVPPYLPHTVVNESKHENAILVEFANAKFSDVKRKIII